MHSMLFQFVKMNLQKHQDHYKNRDGLVPVVELQSLILESYESAVKEG